MLNGCLLELACVSLAHERNRAFNCCRLSRIVSLVLFLSACNAAPVAERGADKIRRVTLACSCFARELRGRRASRVSPKATFPSPRVFGEGLPLGQLFGT